MLSDEEKKLRVKAVKDIPFNRFVLSKNRAWPMFRANNYYRMIVLTAMVLQFLADICCLFLSFIRGIWTSWAINPLLIILACFGVFGAIRVEPVSLFIHAIGCYIGLFIIIIGCTDNYVEYSEAIVWALHAPGVIDLICALMTTFMAASIVRCGCCGTCCCLHSADDPANDNVSPYAVEEGDAHAAAAPTTTTSSANPSQPAVQRVASGSVSSESSAEGGVEMQQAAQMGDRANNGGEVNFDELDDEAKMAALQKQQQQQQQQP